MYCFVYFKRGPLVLKYKEKKAKIIFTGERVAIKGHLMQIGNKLVAEVWSPSVKMGDRGPDKQVPF